MPDKSDLRQRQALPLSAKVVMSENRIRDWYQHFNGDVCVSFSGGKDSTVLAHLVHDLYKEVPLVFCDTGLEYPEIKEFARKMGAETIRPKMVFSEVISKYGYPIISKENAEAIYYARKIRNGGGKQQKENGLNSTENELPERFCPPQLVGGVQRNSIQERKSHGDSVSMYQGRTGWRRATLTGKPLSKFEGGGTKHIGGERTSQRNGNSTTTEPG